MAEAWELGDALHVATTHRDHESMHAEHEHSHVEHLERIAQLEAALAEHERRLLEHLASEHAPEPEAEAELEEIPERVETEMEEVAPEELPKVEAVPRASHWALRRYGSRED